MQSPLFLLALLLPFFSLFGEEKVLMEKAVPNRIIRQGDLRVKTSGEQLILQIDLQTRHLGRIQKKILQSETANWPESYDSLQYQQTLSKVIETSRPRKDGKTEFFIEWRLGSNGGGSVLLRNAENEVSLTELSPTYLERNMAIILADNFDFSEAEALEWIQKQLSPSEHP